MNKFRFTQEDLDNMVLEALEKEPEKSTSQPKIPNLLQMIRSKKGLNKEQTWPLA